MFWEQIADGSCLDESLRIFGSWPYFQHDVSTPAGTEGYIFQFTPTTPAGGAFVLIGESSGKVYYSQFGMPAIEAFRLGPGEIYQFRSHERYITEEGEKLSIDWRIGRQTL